MADPARARRLAKRIMTIAAMELEHQVKDPRLKMVTLTAATMTSDLRDVTIYYTVFGDDEDTAATAAALQSATGLVRGVVGQQIGIKFTPTIAFVRDTVREHSRRIESLLAEARASDAAIAARARGASFAGEPDPYRVPDREAADADDEEP